MPSFLSEKIHQICMSSVPIISVDIVILNSERNKILLFKRSNKPLKGVFYTLGGRVFKNESIVDTAIRKLKEEAGLLIAKQDLFLGGIMEEFFEDSIYRDVETHNVNIFFGYVLSKKCNIQMDCQHSQYKWFDIESHDLHPHVRYKIDLVMNAEYFFYDSELDLSIPGENIQRNKTTVV